MRIKTAKFDFVKLVRSHGWIFLSPFRWFPENETLARPLSISKRRNIQVTINTRQYPNHTSLRVIPNTKSPLTDFAKNKIKAQIRRMFRLDEDFSEFQQICKHDSALKFVHEHHCGGILRSPTFFEDLLKTVCTTNCDWQNTKKMCECLCMLDAGNFPTAEDILRYSPDELSRKVPLGYRIRTIYEIAHRVAQGRLSLDELAEAGDYDQIRTRLKDIWGIGEYSINHMLVLLGDYSRIPVDSEVLIYLRNTHFKGRAISVKEAVKPYDKYGKFKFLAFKFGRMARKLNYINK